MKLIITITPNGFFVETLGVFPSQYSFSTLEDAIEYAKSWGDKYEISNENTEQLIMEGI